MRPSLRLCFALLAVAAVAIGCQTGPRLAGLNSFFRPERTSFQTPAQRIEAIRLVAKKSTREDTPEQETLVRGLITDLPTEQDPLIRQAILEATAEFKTTLASKALLAGLSDESPHVREASCRLLTASPVAGSADALATIAHGDPSFDVRVAAAKALGRNGATRQQLLPVLEDPNPAMQLAGVEAMRDATGKDFGGDVSAYRALARGETPSSDGDGGRIEVANRLPSWVPFF
ncbi:MAG: HEAT repeat domain-containing protein [Planctomycetota bacterium]